MTRTRHQELLDQALSGDTESLGSLLEAYRPYLTVVARRQLDERVRGRVDENDMVQVTFLEAQRDLKSFRGSHVEELLGWLRHILLNNVSTAHQKHLYAQKRSANREMGQSPTDGSPSIVEMVKSESSSPSQQVMRHEAELLLAHYMADLPDTQQEALRLRYVENCSLKEIAARMQKTEMAAAGLLKRGLQTLRERMATESSSGGFPF